MIVFKPRYISFLLLLFAFGAFSAPRVDHVLATKKGKLLDRFDFYIAAADSGEIVTRHKNGRVNIRLPFKKGLRDGVAVIYYDNGQKETERLYKNGLIMKPIKTWHKNGQLMSIMPIENQVSHGIFKKWNDSGKLILEETYINGKREGESKEWFDSGKIKVINTFFDGELKYSKQYDESGKLFFESDFAKVRK